MTFVDEKGRTLRVAKSGGITSPNVFLYRDGFAPVLLDGFRGGMARDEVKRLAIAEADRMDAARARLKG